MDDNIKALLTYLNLPTTGKYIVTPTSFYLVEGSWLITPKDYGIKVTTMTGNTDVRDLKAYALLMSVIGDSKHIIPYTEQVIESLIRRVTDCTMNRFDLVYDPDGSSVEVMATLVQTPGVDGAEDKMVSRRTWRIDTSKKTLHLYTPNQWILEVSDRDVKSYYQDIAGCLILLNIITNRNSLAPKVK